MEVFILGEIKMDIDLERLRNDLLNYFGSAYGFGFSIAVLDLSRVEIASEEELIQIAIQNGFNLENYERGKVKKYY